MKKKRKDKGYSTSYDNRGCDSRKLIFDLPDDIPFYKIKEKNNAIIILAWEIQSKKNPMVVKGHRKVGEWAFEMDVFVHMLSKPSKIDVFCLNRNYTKSDAICDHAKELYDAGKEKDYSFIKAKRRVYYWILDIMELDKGIQFFSPGGQMFFGKDLIEEANECSKGESIIDFSADGDNDIHIIKFRTVNTPIGKSSSYLKYKSFRFINIEKEEVDDSKDIKKAVEKAMENIVSLDSLLIVKTEDEIKKLMYLEEDDDDNEEEEKETKNKKSKSEDDDNEENDEEEEEKKSKKDESNDDECPHDLEFGKDFEKEKICSKCDLWEECCDEQAAIKKRNKK